MNPGANPGHMSRFAAAIAGRLDLLIQALAACLAPAGKGGYSATGRWVRPSGPSRRHSSSLMSWARSAERGIDEAVALAGHHRLVEPCEWSDRVAKRGSSVDPGV